MKRILLNKYFVILFFILFYFISRFQHLTAIPIFADEAIYIRWSQIIKNVETLRFIPLNDGKQPFFMWLIVPAFKFFNDPLVSGRFISILSGFGTLSAVYLISNLISSVKKEKNILKLLHKIIFSPSQLSLISVLFYIFIPYTFFFDRLATPDNLLTFLGSVVLFLSLLLGKYPRLDISIFLGVFLGLALITKSPAVYFVLLSLITTFIFYENKKYILLSLFSCVIGILIYNLLRLGPQFQQIAIRNLDYFYPLSEIIKHPFDPFKPHFIASLKLFLSYISFPVIATTLIGFIFKKLNKIKTFDFKYINILIIWWLLPLILNCTFTKVFTGRYILIILPPLIVTLSVGVLFFLKQFILYDPSRLLPLAIIILMFLTNLYFISKISLDPFNTKLPETESGYLVNWTSGWGIQKAADYLIKKSAASNVIVGTEGYFGTLPDGLQVYTDSKPRITVFGVGLGFNKIPSKLIDANNFGDDVYLLINQSRLNLVPDEYNQLEIAEIYPKPDKDNLILYHLK